MDPEASSADIRKRLGAFYTPDSTASSLARWAIRTGEEAILEPSVGGGALLKAAIARARELAPFGDHARPFACDINISALEALRNELGETVEFHSGDFFSLDPEGCRKFDVVIGNPPFTRNHSIELDMRANLRKRFRISGAAGIWVYFLAHSMNFLTQGGRIASVAPGSSLFTQYGDAFVRRMCKSFRTVHIYELAERPIWTGGAQERGAVILAEGYLQGESKDYKKGTWPPRVGLAIAQDQPLSEVPAYCDINSASRPLRDVASISIGAVTGCNSVFLLTEQERTALGVSLEDVTLTVSRARHVEGLTIGRGDLVDLARSGQKTWLLTPRSLERRGSPTRKRLAQITKHQRRSICWMNKRRPWWRIETGPNCDGIFTYMNQRGPRLALAKEKIVCTNTLHRVVFHTLISEADKVAAALTFISTFGQMAERKSGVFMVAAC